MKKVYTILATALLATLFSGQVMGQTTRTWDGEANTSNWGDANNWSGNTVPTAVDNVVIPSVESGVTSIIVNVAAACNNLTLSANSKGIYVTFPSSGNMQLIVNGNLTLQAGGGKNKENAIWTQYGSLKLNGSVSLAATGTILNTLGTVEFSATSGTQSIPALTYTILKFSGGSNKLITGRTTVSGSLVLTNGIVSTTSTNILVLEANATVTEASDNSFVDGPVEKIISPSSAAFDFPVGKTGHGYRPFTLSSLVNNGGNASLDREFVAQFFRADPQTDFPTATFAGGVTSVNRREYWSLSILNGNNAVTFTQTIGWSSTSGINSTTGTGLIPAILNFSTLNVWGAPSGSATIDGTNKKMTKTGVVQSFTTAYYTFGSGSSGAFAPLPVTFGTIKAFEKGTGVQVDWTSYSELNIANYQVERSADGINFTSIGEVAPRNVTDASNYNFFDAMPLSGTSFYRIRNNDIDGKSGLSTIVKVNLNKNIKTINVYPNPVRGNRVSFQTSDLAKGLYNVEVYNTMGSRVFSQAINHAGGAITQTLSLPTLQSGQYTLRINGTSSSSIHKITILQ